MYRVKAYFRNHVVVQTFSNIYDAIEFKDVVDANYPLRVTFEKGVYPVSTFIVNCWNGVMDYKHNPLRHIPDMNTRHMLMQVLAWMWCIVFGLIVGSWTVFSISAIAHVALIAAICVTVGVFETARRKPDFFRLRTDGYHSVSRARGYMWINGKKIELDPRDPGGEHE